MNLIDRLSHFAVFPSNEISKSSRRNLNEGRKQARKRKERKRRRGMMMIRTTKAALIQIDETQMMME